MTQSINRSTQPGPRDARSWELAQQLKASPFFASTTDAKPWLEKQPIFLVLAGVKPVAEASSGHWVPTPDGRRTVHDNPAAVGALLDSLGLAYRLRHDDYATDTLVSSRPELLDAYEVAAAADDQAKIGELFGYPATAVMAFAHHPEHPLSAARSGAWQCIRR